MGHPQFRADWSFVVVERTSGEIAAYQLASYDPESPAIFGYSEGYTELLGVLRPWRGKGIAPAMLRRGNAAFPGLRDGERRPGRGHRESVRGAADL